MNSIKISVLTMAISFFSVLSNGAEAKIAAGPRLAPQLELEIKIDRVSSEDKDFFNRMMIPIKQGGLLTVTGKSFKMSYLTIDQDGNVSTKKLDGLDSRYRVTKVDQLEDGRLFVSYLLPGPLPEGQVDGAFLIWNWDQVGQTFYVSDKLEANGLDHFVGQMPDGQIVTAHQTGDESYALYSTRIWEQQNGEWVSKILLPENALYNFKKLKDGRVITTDDRYQLMVWSLNQGQWVSKKISGDRSFFGLVEVLADGRILTYTDDDKLKIWSPIRKEFKLTQTISIPWSKKDLASGHNTSPKFLRQLKDGRVVSVSNEGSAFVWSERKGKWNAKRMVEQNLIFSSTFLSSDEAIWLATERRAGGNNWIYELNLWSQNKDGQFNPNLLSNNWIISIIQLSDGRIVTNQIGKLGIWRYQK